MTSTRQNATVPTALRSIPVRSRDGRPICVWEKWDWVTGIIAGLISFAIYAWSAAPNVTLLDSGEFLVAAEHFGVPHPTGYPLWTLLNWLFLLLPLGNAAWEVALCSGLCAAAAVGLCAALLSSTQIWCYGARLSGRARLVPRVIALAFSLMLAFSQSMWSQAVIAEVYALHALLIAVFLVLCYSWVQRPASDWLMLSIFFLLALSLSNHHLTMSLAPLPYLLILLLRRRAFVDWLFAGLITILLGNLGFAILSEDAAVLKTAIRLFYCVALAFGVFVWLRRGRLRWRLIAFLPVVVAAGLLPYAYMPLASSTNPPMNWGYTRDAEGFFFSINRSQYSGSLSEVTVKSLGRLMGTSQLRQGMAEDTRRDQGGGRWQRAQLWVGFFWQQLIKAFSIAGLVGYFSSFCFVFRFPLPKRVWIYLLHVAFVLAAFLQPLTANAKIDNADWWTQMPYHTYTNLIFATLSGLGIGLLALKLLETRAHVYWLVWSLLALPFLTFAGSENSSSQRGRWFGWMYGHDMLNDLPAESVMIGGTDPGRFVPTYMIFGESGQPAKNKRDPSFDRRDLYIITQNALGERNYMKYLRDQYTASRPKASGAFARWLGRENAYPTDPLIFPSEQETEEMVKIAARADQESGGSQGATELFGVILRWLWEKNRDQHEFFIEESFPIRWTYDYAVPHGLIYRLNKTKLEALPPEIVEKDFAYWKEYSARLLSDPNFKKDFDAQRSFSKLRQSIANIYRHRKMSPEAERAYREALALWPGNAEAIALLTSYLWDRGDFEEAIALCDRALVDDPNSVDLWRLRVYAEKRKETEAEIRALRETLVSQPKSGQALRRLIELYSSVGDTNKATPLIEQVEGDFPDDADMLRFVIQYYEELGALPKTLDAARRLTLVETSNVQNYLLLARACFVLNKKEEFYEAASRAIQLGGSSLRRAFVNDPTFSRWKDDPEFKNLTEGQSLSPN
jgi:tetratricopeptide (TPR) repeat protein